MDNKLNKLFFVANKLDKSGNYKLSDKIYDFIKVSQAIGMQTPANYKNVRPATTPATGLFENLGDTSLGYFLAGGQYDPQAPGKFSGPDAPLVQTTLTPTQMAWMEKNDPVGLAKIQLQEGLRAQQYVAQSGAPFASIGRIISQWLGPNVSEEKKESFKNFVLPNVMSSTISNLLSSTPVNQWETKIKDLEKTASLSSPNYASFINNAIRESVKKTLDDMKFQNAVKFKQLQRDSSFQQFQRKFNVI